MRGLDLLGALAVSHGSQGHAGAVDDVANKAQHLLARAGKAKKIVAFAKKVAARAKQIKAQAAKAQAQAAKARAKAQAVKAKTVAKAAQAAKAQTAPAAVTPHAASYSIAPSAPQAAAYPTVAPAAVHVAPTALRLAPARMMVVRGIGVDANGLSPGDPGYDPSTDPDASSAPTAAAVSMTSFLQAYEAELAAYGSALDDAAMILSLIQQITQYLPSVQAAGLTDLYTQGQSLYQEAINYDPNNPTDLAARGAQWISAARNAGATKSSGGGSVPGSSPGSGGPSISGVAPSTGYPGDTVTFTGYKLSGATSASFNGVAAPLTVLDDSHATAQVPQGATSGPVSITTPSGTAVAPGTFTVNAAPAGSPDAGGGDYGGGGGGGGGFGGGGFGGGDGGGFDAGGGGAGGGFGGGGDAGGSTDDGSDDTNTDDGSTDDGTSDDSADDSTDGSDDQVVGLHGLDIFVGYAPPDVHWYTIATPGDILAEMDKVMREGDTLDSDIAALDTDDGSFPKFHKAWTDFWATYKKFYDDNKGWFSRLSSSTGDQVVAYGNQLNDWRAKFGQFPGAKPTEPKITDVMHRKDPTKFNWTPVVIGAVVVAGLAGGGYALAKVGAIAALFKKTRT